MYPSAVSLKTLNNRATCAILAKAEIQKVCMVDSVPSMEWRIGRLWQGHHTRLVEGVICRNPH